MKDNVRMDFRELGCEVVGCIELPSDVVQWHTFVNTVNELWSSIKLGNSLIRRITISY
jgi:hypothetical protein